MSFLLIVGLLLFVGLVVVHEYGHFIVARRNGVEVEEFGIGFPPRAWKKRIKSSKGDYDFTLNWLPLGGFVRLKGESDSASEKGSFGAASLPAKVKIMVAGVIMNLITAFVLFTVVAWLGMPRFPEQAISNQFSVTSDERVIKEVKNQDVVLIGRIVEGSPAERAGLVEGDELVSINGTSIDLFEDVQPLTESNAGQVINVTVRGESQQDSRQETVVLNDEETAQDQGYLGVVPISGAEGFKIVSYSWSAPIVAVGSIVQFTQLTFQGLGQALQGFGTYLVSFVSGNQEARQAGGEQASSQITGPLGIFFTLSAVSQEGLSVMLFIIALISLALAIMNILPIPALDGGRLFVTLLFRGLKKPLTKETEEKIHGTGFVVLMALFILITVVDVRRFF
ncbi:RIP metalloprotease RseP [soil metagenome]